MSDDLSRRGFLKTSAAAAAAIAAGAQMVHAQPVPAPAPAPAAAKPAAPKPKKTERKTLAEVATTQTKYSQIKVACIGVGGRGGDDLYEVAQCGANIVAICDIDTNTLNKIGESLPNAKKWTDYREMLQQQKDIDAVVVATPDHSHAPAALRAMRMGKHCYCEKPLTYTIEEARKMADTAMKHKLVTQMGNQGAADNAERRQIEYVRSGIVGPIKEVHMYTNRPIWPQGLHRPTKVGPVPEHIKYDLWLGPAAERPYYVNDAGESVYLPFKWRGWWDFGTGALGDMACHIMNTAFWSLNLTNPAVVEAFSDGKTDVQAPRWSVIKYEFPALGDRPALTAFWYDGHLMPPQTLVKDAKYPGGDNGTIFVGEKGSIGAPYVADPYLIDEKQQKELKPPPRTMPRSIGHHKEWLEGILGGPTPASSFDYSGPLTEMVLLGNLAVRTGKRLEWDRKQMKVTNDHDANRYVRRTYRKGFEV
jgi:predicted dehydrogenase